MSNIKKNKVLLTIVEVLSIFLLGAIVGACIRTLLRIYFNW
jgi:hypothetical protein